MDNEKKILAVIIITIFAMVLEIFLGYLTNSMSLTAAGFHMSVHVLTLSLSFVAYVLARKYVDSEKFENGTDKICTLAGYTSSLFLGISALWICFESIMRLINPEPILFTEAIYASIFAFVVNLICIIVMEGKLNFHSHNCADKDYNFKAAYFHILSDILMSVLTVFALVIGKYFHSIHIDALTGILGGVLIFIWAANLSRHTIKILVDMK